MAEWFWLWFVALSVSALLMVATLVPFTLALVTSPRPRVAWRNSRGTLGGPSRPFLFGNVTW